MNKKIIIAGLLIAMLFVSAGSLVAGFGPPKVVVGVKVVGEDAIQSDKFNTNEDMYVWGDNFESGSTVYIYIVDDINWVNGVTDVTNMEHRAVYTVSVGLDGSFGPVAVWNDPLIVGKYDILADTNNDMIWTEGVDAINSATTFGVAVVPESSTIALMSIGLLSMMGYIGLKKVN